VAAEDYHVVTVGVQCTRENGADLTRAARDHDLHRFAPRRADITMLHQVTSKRSFGGRLGAH
jgi:hypothetical protein